MWKGTIICDWELYNVYKYLIFEELSSQSLYFLVNVYLQQQHGEQEGEILLFSAFGSF